MNPFADSRPVAAPKLGAAGRTSIDFSEAAQFVFCNPNWVQNLVLCGVCYLPFYCGGALIPYLGGILSLFGWSLFKGYGWEASASLLVTNGAVYPDFDFNRLSTYFSRAMGWLVWTFINFLVAGVVVAALIGGTAAFDGKEVREEVVIGTFVGIAITLGLSLFLFSFVTQPMMFRAAITGRVSDVFDFRWGIHFVKTMWFELFFCWLYMVAISIAASFVGTLMLCIGVIFAYTYIFLVQSHLEYQMYEVYLTRGGIPITAAAQNVVAGYTPDPTNPYAAPAGGGYTPSPMYNPPRDGGSSLPPSWPPPPGKPTE